MIVEVCANSISSALAAERAGADRVELCSELGLGGITPSYGFLKTAVATLNIPLHVLIRPRSGDFTYTSEEFDAMLADIALCKSLGVAGVVSGVLLKDGSIDRLRTAMLIQQSEGMSFTFHRAFDWVPDPLAGAEALDAMGVDCLLSSGQKRKAMEGIEILQQLKNRLSKVVVMPGGGVREEEARQLKSLGFQALHLSAVKQQRQLDSSPGVSMISPAMIGDEYVWESDPEIISAVVHSVK